MVQKPLQSYHRVQWWAKRQAVHPLVSRKIYRKISIYLNFHAISKNSNSLKSGRTENSKGQRSVNDEYEYELINITKHVREVEYIFPEKDDYTPENVEQKKGCCLWPSDPILHSNHSKSLSRLYLFVSTRDQTIFAWWKYDVENLSSKTTSRVLLRNLRRNHYRTRSDDMQEIIQQSTWKYGFCL